MRKMVKNYEIKQNKLYLVCITLHSDDEHIDIKQVLTYVDHLVTAVDSF